MRRQDEKGKTELAIKKAVKKAIEKAVENAIEKTKEEEKNENAIKGIKAGYPNEIIHTITGLNVNQINELRKQIE